jgi:MarR family transcriptional regulator, 2-MHQ and catechol-resistance regulon repressor
MGIEDDIHQVTFQSAQQKAMLNVMYTYGWIIERVKTFLTNEDITHQQFNILRILRGAAPEPLSTLQIRERMLDKMSDTSRIVDRLVSKGLVKKVVCGKDKRLVDVTITEQGLKLLKRLDAEGDHITDIMRNLTAQESETLSTLLDKLRKSD